MSTAAFPAMISGMNFMIWGVWILCKILYTSKKLIYVLYMQELNVGLSFNIPLVTYDPAIKTERFVFFWLPVDDNRIHNNADFERNLEI
jgi:hypothetical protein